MLFYNPIVKNRFIQGFCNNEVFLKWKWSVSRRGHLHLRPGYPQKIFLGWPLFWTFAQVCDRCPQENSLYYESIIGEGHHDVWPNCSAYLINIISTINTNTAAAGSNQIWVANWFIFLLFNLGVQFYSFFLPTWHISFHPCLMFNNFFSSPLPPLLVFKNKMKWKTLTCYASYDF